MTFSMRPRQVRRIFLRSSLRWTLFAIFLLFTLPTWAVELFFAEPKSFGEQAQRITDTLKSSTGEYLQHPIESVSSNTAGALTGNTNLVVALGPEALDEVLSGPGSAPVLAVFVSKTSFETIIDRHVTSRKRPVSAVFSDPDPVKQVALVKALYGPSASSVLINSKTVNAYVEDYLQAAKTFGVNLNIVSLEDVKSSSDFIRATRSAKTLVLLKDQDLFERISLEKVLLSSYDINRQGVIGYSRGLVKNGGAATTFSSVDNIAHSIYLQVNRISENKSIEPPHYTVSFEVSLNKYVLRSLDLIDMSEETVQNKIVSIIQEGYKR